MQIEKITLALVKCKTCNKEMFSTIRDEPYNCYLCEFVECEMMEKPK